MTADSAFQTPAPGSGAAPRLATGAMQDQVAALLLQRIANGVYPPGQLIAGNRVLAEQLGVSKPTVERAMATLRSLGVVRGVPAVGTFVVDVLPATVPTAGPEPMITGRRAQPRSRPAKLLTLPEWAAQVIRARIARGTYPPGSKLPIRTVLAAELDIVVSQADKAMAILIQEGLVHAHRLQGSFVRTDLPTDLGPTIEPARPNVLVQVRHIHHGKPRRRGASPRFGDRTPKQFGEALERARRAAQLTVTDLAATVGVSATTLSEIERGYLNRPMRSSIDPIADWLERTERAGHTPTPSAGPAAAPAPTGPVRYFLGYNYPDDDEPGGRGWGNTFVTVEAPLDGVEAIRSIENQIARRLQAMPPRGTPLRADLRVSIQSCQPQL